MFPRLLSRSGKAIAPALMPPALLLAAFLPALSMAAESRKINYPESSKVAQVDDYHGVKVADPYRWLEDPDSKETKAWVEAENKVTFAFLDTIPERVWLRERLTKLWNYERFGTPFRRGKHYFYSRNDGLQNQNVYYTMTSLEAEPRVLLDPNKLSADGTVALSGLALSDDGTTMAYGLSTAGSDWQEWKVRDVESGKDLTDNLKWIKFSGATFTIEMSSTTIR